MSRTPSVDYLGAFLLAAIIVLGGPGRASLAGTPEKTVPQIVEEQGPAVVLISNLRPLNVLQAFGSGFLVKSNGVLITNYHVVERASALKVKFTDGREFDVVGTIAFEPQLDLAILKISGEKLPTVRLGDSTAVKVGRG